MDKVFCETCQQQKEVTSLEPIRNEKGNRVSKMWEGVDDKEHVILFRKS